MGYSRWDEGKWSSYRSVHVDKKSTVEIYSSSKIKEEYDPLKIEVRESKDSDLNPNSNAIIIALDVTGSMDRFRFCSS